MFGDLLLNFLLFLLSWLIFINWDHKKYKDGFYASLLIDHSTPYLLPILWFCQGTLKNGREVAVKMLSTSSKQGLREFLTEINTISNVRHPCLVELIGCCVHGNDKILVYEYVENNSLDQVLLGKSNNFSVKIGLRIFIHKGILKIWFFLFLLAGHKIKLDWEKRSAICLGTARGLAFLHEELVPHIVHRDIKASNILLDKDFSPKIGDFGLAKLFPDDITHISTRIAGTTYVVFQISSWLWSFFWYLVILPPS